MDHPRGVWSDGLNTLPTIQHSFSIHFCPLLPSLCNSCYIQEVLLYSRETYLVQQGKAVYLEEASSHGIFWARSPSFSCALSASTLGTLEGPQMILEPVGYIPLPALMKGVLSAHPFCFHSFNFVSCCKEVGNNCLPLPYLNPSSYSA